VAKKADDQHRVYAPDRLEGVEVDSEKIDRASENAADTLFRSRSAI
jgi:hypothetical protein